MKRLLAKRREFARMAYFGACFAVCLTWVAHAPAQEASGPTQETCLRFVQGFYDWYVPLTKKRMNEPTFNVALQTKPDVFNPDLLQALRVDSEASAHAKDDIVGIDFDPFIGGQDPAGRYEARNATLRNNKCSVEIWRVSPTGKAANSGKPDVIADVGFDRGHWKFVNFRYPDVKTDLLSVLKTLREERNQ
jgi:hypothetical protein